MLCNLARRTSSMPGWNLNSSLFHSHSRYRVQHAASRSEYSSAERIAHTTSCMSSTGAPTEDRTDLSRKHAVVEARRFASGEPKPPRESECCGSGCEDCVWLRYRNNLLEHAHVRGHSLAEAYDIVREALARLEPGTKLPTHPPRSVCACLRSRDVRSRISLSALLCAAHVRMCSHESFSANGDQSPGAQGETTTRGRAT
jgi:Oxidoreductase-like protein, N-terminal